MDNEERTIDLTSHDILGVSLEWMLFALQHCGLKIKNIVPCAYAKGAIAVETELGDWLFAYKGNKYVCAGFSEVLHVFDEIPSMYP